ncbi:MAG: FtsW/RodA/SpoVE family cell cycle protein [Phycisphaerae bacterium]
MDDSIYRLKPADALTLAVLALLAFGTVMVLSAGMNVQDSAGWQFGSQATRHLCYAVLAFLTYFTLSQTDYARLLKPGNRLRSSPLAWGMLVAVLLCGLVLVPGVGVEVNGARRWLRLGFLQLQASEVAKWMTVVFLAWWLTSRPVDLSRFFKGFLPTCVPVAVVCLLVVLQDFGTAALIGACALAMFVAGRVRAWHLLMGLVPALALAAVFVAGTPYRLARMTSFVDPWADPEGRGYHMVQSLMSFASGGLTGRGLGAGVQKLGYLPEDTTDFIFAVICEETGLFGALLVIGLYAVVLGVAWGAIRRTPDGFGRMLAFGVAVMLGLQACINMAVATVSVPTKGMSLPLISAGGSGLVLTCAALGLLASVLRHPHGHQTVARAVTPDLVREWTTPGPMVPTGSH